MSDLKLDRPLVFFDLETTGTVIARDRIVEISVIKLFPDGRKQTHTRLINPEMPIPKSSSDIHGITDEEVKDAPTFKHISQNLYVYFEGCDLAGYNLIKFDIPMLFHEFRRCGLEFSLDGRRVIDAFNIFCKLYPRSLEAAYEFFCDKKLDGAHRAEADTEATMEVLFGQLKKHPELPRDLDGLHEFSDMTDPDAVDKSGRFKWAGDEVVVNFGKHSGMPLKQLAVDELGFLKWIIRSDFPDDVKTIASNALQGVFPEKKADGKED